MADPACPFCFPDATRIFHAGDQVLGLWDRYPVSPGHALLIPRRHVADWFEVTAAERDELTAAIDVARKKILERHRPDGFNIGVNVGAVAGQTISHLHVHVIPRYQGDVGDPRGGVRHVIREKALYPLGDEPAPVVRDAETSWIAGSRSTSEVPPGDRRDTPRENSAQARPGVTSDAAAFGERLLQLLDEGRFTATYKYAVLLGLTELCLEQGAATGGAQVVTTRQLAEKIVELYWPQTAPYQGQSGARVLAQNRGGQAEIISAIRKFRERHAADPSEPLNRARLQARERYERLVKLVEWKLIEMPLPRLQVIGESETRFLYRIGWTTGVKRQDIERGDFDNRIYLADRVGEHLVQLSGLLRPLIQRAWAGMIAALNRDATDEARLQEFLFGAQRISLDPVRQDLRELQNNRCFYCDKRMEGQVDVDHFIPWARHPDNGIDNLVIADQRCNGDKRDFLAAGEHVEHWAARASQAEGSLRNQLAEIAARAGWEHHPERTLNVARTIYSRLPDDVRLWLQMRKFVPVASQRERLLQALGAGTSLAC